MNPEGNKAGVIAKIFGVIMILLGGMNCMLAWRGAFSINTFFLVLIGFGLMLFCLGVILTNGSSKGGIDAMD